MKNVSRHQHDKKRYSRIATVDSCFAFFGARQHCVVTICNASPTANVHKLQNDPFAISSSVLWTHLCPETRAAASRVSGHKETKCHCWCFERPKIMNVAGQLCTLAVGWTLHIFATQCWRAPKRAKQQSTVAILLNRFLSCWFFLKRFSCSISLAFNCL